MSNARYGRHERCKSITQTPPPKSRLAQYVDFFEKTAAGGPPLWADPDPSIREIGGQRLICENLPLCNLPSEVVREWIVIPALYKLGMPSTGLDGIWFDWLIDCAVSQLKASSKTEERQDIATRKQGRSGHPKAKPWPALVIFTAYLDTFASQPKNAQDNRRFEMVARRLGPGINRYHIRRAVKNFRQMLGGMSESHCVVLLQACLRLSEIMREHDKAGMSVCCGRKQSAGPTILKPKN